MSRSKSWWRPSARVDRTERSAVDELGGLPVGEVPVECAPQTFLEIHARPPPEELLGAANGDPAPGLTVGLARIPHELTLVPDDASDGLDGLADGDLVIGADVDGIGADVVFGGEHDCLRGILDVEVFAAGTTGAPHVDLVDSSLLGVDAALHQRRDDVRHRRMELVARSEQVGRYEVREPLTVLCLVDLGVDQVRLLGDAVRRVRLLGVAIPEARLEERYGGELRI